ncbi:MAG: DUF3592 domain-containing protein, partial [Phycisphaerales bacterium]
MGQGRGIRSWYTTRWQVGYVYEVNGERLFSNCKSLMNERGGVHGSPWDCDRACPPKSRVTAYFDPPDPKRAVLRRGARASDFLIPALVSVFLPLGLWLTTNGVIWIREFGVPLVAAGLPVIEFDGRVGVSLSRADPVAVGFASSSLVLVGGTMANGTVMGRLPDGVLIGMAVVVLLAAGAGIASARWTRSFRRRPAALLTFDRRAGTVQIPEGEDRDQPLLLEMAEVIDFRVERREVGEPAGDTETIYFVTMYAVAKDGRTLSHVVRRFSRESYALSLSQWCRERLLEAIEARS